MASVQAPVEISAVSAGGDDAALVEAPEALPHPSKVGLVPIADIAELHNDRTNEDYDDIDRLAETLRSQGQLEPCLVRPAGTGAKHGKPYELVYGYRRKRAAELLGWDGLRCDVREMDDGELVERQITENYHRRGHTPVAEARLMKRLVDDCDLTHAEVAARLGCDRSHVSHRLALLNLSAPVIERVERGELTASAAEVCSSLKTPQAQEKLAGLAVKHGWTTRKMEEWAQVVRVDEAREELAGDAGDEPLTLDLVTAGDVVDLTRFKLRDELNEEEWLRLTVYGQLRMFLDKETLDWLREEQGIEYEGLWSYVSELDADELAELSRRQTQRFLEAAHRYYSLEESLKMSVGRRPGFARKAHLAPLGSQENDEQSPDVHQETA